MKILLAALMCFVLATAECAAVSGGPIYPAGTDIYGTYAGVLQGLFDPTNPSSSNSIGVFSLGVPRTGLSSGAFLMFARGRTFTGRINAAGDPDRGTVSGLLQASFNFNLQRTELNEDGKPVVVSIPITATANGPISTTVVTPTNARGATGAATRLTGEATLSITGGFVSGSTGEPIVTSVLLLSVTGFKQSTTAAASTTLG
ncbi:MAG TPA: hypothetical protein VF683_04240 [Chthoniobacterales bacterium]|jgi:hypothetical protein